MKILVNMNWDVSIVTEMDKITAQLEEAGYEIVLDNCGRRLSEDELIERLQGMDAFLGTANPFTERVFQACPDLKIIARTGVTYLNLFPWPSFNKDLPAMYIPTTYFVDSSGMIVGEAAVGARDADAYEELVDSILKELDER